jgi:hypothetical protein
VAKLLLQRAHLLADGGGGYEQLGGSLGKAQVAGSGLKGAQSVEGRQASLGVPFASRSGSYIALDFLIQTARKHRFGNRATSSSVGYQP